MLRPCDHSWPQHPPSSRTPNRLPQVDGSFPDLNAGFETAATVENITAESARDELLGSIAVFSSRRGPRFHLDFAPEVGSVWILVGIREANVYLITLVESCEKDVTVFGPCIGRDAGFFISRSTLTEVGHVAASQSVSIFCP